MRIKLYSASLRFFPQNYARVFTYWQVAMSYRCDGRFYVGNPDCVFGRTVSPPVIPQ